LFVLCDEEIGIFSRAWFVIMVAKKKEPFRPDGFPCARKEQGQFSNCGLRVNRYYLPVHTENLIRVDAVMESPKLAE
jgi:hypothetical protein